jgi:putative SOS response-associated peptidase YedK
MAQVHDRMPVILPRGAWDQWSGGSEDTALALCRSWPGALLADHTSERWTGGEASHNQARLL